MMTGKENGLTPCLPAVIDAGYAHECAPPPKRNPVGGLFPGATAYIHHYGDDMAEFPGGCVLALREIKDLKNGFIPGENYVVEFGLDMNMVTRRIYVKNGEIWAYSTNEGRYADGQQIHQPFRLNMIHRAWLVVGFMAKTR